MAPLLSRQPFQAVATLLFSLSVPPYLVLLCIFYARKKNRPYPGWSLKTALGTKMLRFFNEYFSRIQIRPTYANAKKLKTRVTLVKPGPSKLYTNILHDEVIKPAGMPAVWFPGPPGFAQSNKLKSSRVVIHFLGGAFVMSLDPVESGQHAAKHFANKLDAMTFYPQYRLARDEQTRFPAALQDVVSFYRYVLDQGFAPERIILSGDSAGGNLVIALLRYIEKTNVLPAPSGVMLWSPWVDVSEYSLAHYRRNKNLNSDYLSMGFMQWGVRAFSPRADSKEIDPYLRPALHPFRSSTPIFINAGTAELLFDEVNTFTAAMKDVEGNRIHYSETKGAPHDMLVIAHLLGLEAETAAAVEEAGRFFNL